MIIQELDYDKYNWHITLLYNVDINDVCIVSDILEDIGISKKNINKIVGLLKHPNTGAAISIPNKSIVIIGRATGYTEFANTYFHELSHIVRHIADYYGIDARSEKEQYLAGDLFSKTFPFASHFICC